MQDPVRVGVLPLGMAFPFDFGFIPDAPLVVGELVGKVGVRAALALVKEAKR